MANSKVDGSELKALIKLGKKRPLSFAFCPGHGDDQVIIIDRKAKPKILSKLALAEGAGKKVAFGTFVVNADTMELTCIRVIPSLAKLLYKYLKSQKIKVGVLIMDDTGEVLEQAGGEAGEDQSAAAGQPDGKGEAEGEEPKPEAARLAARIKALQSVIDAASASNAAKLSKALARAVSQVRAGDLQGAEQTIAAMEGAIARKKQKEQEVSAADPDPKAQQDTPDTSAQYELADRLQEKVSGIGGPAGDKLGAALSRVRDLLDKGNVKGADALLARIKGAVDKRADSTKTDNVAKWEQAKAKLQPIIASLKQSGRGDQAAMDRFFKIAQEQAKAGNLDKAMAAAARVVELIRQANAEPKTAASPDNSDVYAKTRLSWMHTRAGLRQEMEDLKSAIDKATAEIDGMEDVSAKSGGMFEHLDNIDNGLEDTLDQLVKTTNTQERQNLKSAASRIIDKYRNVLDSDFFQAVDDNGFRPTSIRANALNSLQEVRAALDA
jgi:hypothetical protein